jgi:muramoyltetrapeptide carboxypeptidase
MPPLVRPGDRVAVVAPSGPVVPDRLTRGVEILTSWGLAVELMPHALDRATDGMFAGTDVDRGRDLEDAWCLPDVKAVVCARGGYGASRLIDLLDWERMRAAGPRWLVGSSDITALHEAVQRRLGLATLYGPMVASEVFASEHQDASSVESLRMALLDGPGVTLAADPPLHVAPGIAHGPLVGGNLALVASAIGTPDMLPSRDAIAFLEDVGEAPYRVDRVLTQLLRSGWFDGVRGVALGTFHQCGDVDGVLRERLSRLQVPVVGGFLVGHGPVQYTIPLGLEVTLDGDRGSLAVHTGD